MCCGVVYSFPKFHYNDLLPSCCRLVADLLTVSLTSPQQVQNRLATFPPTAKLRETRVMDFGQYGLSSRHVEPDTPQLTTCHKLPAASVHGHLPFLAACHCTYYVIVNLFFTYLANEFCSVLFACTHRAHPLRCKRKALSTLWQKSAKVAEFRRCLALFCDSVDRA